MNKVNIKEITIEVNTADDTLAKEEKAKQQALEKEKAESKQTASALAAIAIVAFILCILFFILAVLSNVLNKEFTSSASICFLVAIVIGLLSFMSKPYNPNDDNGPT